MNLFQEMLQLPRSGVVALYNRNNNRVFLTLAKNLAKHVATIATELQDGSFKHREMLEDKDNLELIVLETLPIHEYDTLRLHMHYWYIYCKDLGMTFYTKHCYLQYRPKVTVGFDFDGNTVAYVKLVTRRNDEVVVGLFDKMYEAEEFVETYYTGKNVFPVYAINEKTRNYVEQEQRRIDRVFKVRMG